MEKNNEALILSFLSVVFMVAGHVWPEWPFLIALSIAPLFRQHIIFKGADAPFKKYFAFILVPLSLAFLIISLINPSLQWFHGLFYGLLMALSFFIFWLTDRHTQNRLGFFTVLIYWLAMEYTAIKIIPEFAHLLLGSTFRMYEDIIAWNTQTGIMGVSAWILLGNILCYYVFFKDPGILRKTFRPLTLLYSLIVLSVPAVISWWLYAPELVVTPEFAVQAYSNPSELPSGLHKYAITGEVFGRTCAWVSVLMILYSLVKRKVTK